jgi:hypothetical protein
MKQLGWDADASKWSDADEDEFRSTVMSRMDFANDQDVVKKAEKRMSVVIHQGRSRHRTRH